MGNELADAFAEKGVLLHEVPVDVVKTIWEADSLVVRIQKQLHTTATQAVPELKGSAMAMDAREPRAPVLRQLLAASPHALFRDPLVLQGQWHCTRCGHTIAHKCLREWLRTAPCLPLVPSAVPEIFHAELPVLIGFQSTHVSHTLAYRRGICWCVARGAWATSAARKLSRPCTGQPTKAARDALARLEKGLPPRLRVHWPCPEAFVVAQ